MASSRTGKLIMRRKFFYHCSSTWHGETFEPRLRTPDDMSKKEPSTPRLCVCPTMAGCFSARMMKLHQPTFVYKTVKPYRSITPRNVWDELVTSERWLIPPVKLVYVTTVNALAVDRIYKAVCQYHRVTKAPSDLLVRLAQYAIAHDVVGGPAWERRLIERWKKTFDIDDPESFLDCRAYDKIFTEKETA